MCFLLTKTYMEVGNPEPTIRSVEFRFARHSAETTLHGRGMKYHFGGISACADHDHEIAIMETYLPPDAISLRLPSER